jgi:hypothetical protein
LRAALADGLVPVVAGFQGIGTHGELTTLGRGGTDLSAVALAVALRAARCELFKDVGGSARGRSPPRSRRPLPAEVDALQLELLAEMGAEVVHPVAVRRARRGKLQLVVRALDDEAPQTVVRPSSRLEDGVLMLAVDRKERMARISLVGPAALTPELLPLPAHGEGAFDEGGLRVVWAEVPVASAASAAQAVTPRSWAASRSATQAFRTSGRSSAPRSAERVSTSTAMARRGTRPASVNQAIRTSDPSSSHVPHTDATGDDDRGDPARRPAHVGAVCSRGDVAVLRAGAQHVLVESGEQADGSGRPSRGQLVGMLGEDPGLLALDCRPRRARPRLREPPTQSERG